MKKGNTMRSNSSYKNRLLGGASSLLIIGMGAGIAQAATVSTDPNAGTPISVSAADGASLTEQTADSNATASVSGVDSTSTNNNLLGTSITLDTLSVIPTATNNSAVATYADAGAAAASTDAALLIDQTSFGNTSATATGTNVTLSAGGTDESALNVSSTLNRATATSNTASSALSDTDIVANATSATLAAIQTNDTATTSATATGTDLSISTGATTGSQLNMSGNADVAAATGNSVSQKLTLDGTALTLGITSATADTTPSIVADTDYANINADGSALVSSLQQNIASPVSATTTSSSLTINTGSTSASSVDLAGNLQDAQATGSTATNGITLSGVDIGTGAAIVASQTNDASSSVTASTTGYVAINSNSLSASAESLTGNKLQTRATGESATNTLTATATSTTLQSPDADYAASTFAQDTGNTADTSLTGSVSAAFATLNDQLVSGDVTAQTAASGSGDAAFTVSVANSVTNGSSINNDSNSLIAQAAAAQAVNSTTLTLGTMDQGAATGAMVANAAVVANIQEVSNTADVLAKVSSSSDPSVLTYVGGNVTASSLSASGNKSQATAEGATATNALAVSATTLDVGATTDAYTAAGTNSNTVDAAFAVSNVQSGGSGSVQAQLLDPLVVRTTVDGNVTGSSLSSTGNGQDAFATGNKSTSSLVLSATSLDGDAALANSQSSNSDVSALIGGHGVGPAAGAVGADAGVVMGFGSDIIDSSIAITGNLIRGSAIGNVASNTVSATATTLNGDGDNQRAETVWETEITADYGLSSNQSLGALASSTTNVFASFGVDQAFDNAVTDSNIAVSNNTQFGEALGNSASNRLTLSATSAGVGADDPTIMLNNNQSGSNADISSNSEMSLYANIASSGSSIALNGNSNTALAVVNNASNTAAISATTLDGGANDANAQSYGYVTADYAVRNAQNSGGTLDSTATTTAYNTDSTDTNVGDNTGSSGLLNGSAVISKNTTTAEGSANRVANSLSVSGTENGATAAVLNTQYSQTTVNATADTVSYGFNLTASDGSPGTDYAASGSRVAVEGNATTALARGNSASNTLTYTVGVSYTGSTTTGAPSNSDASWADAGAVVLNAQTNLGNVSATASDVSYAVALNQGNAGAMQDTSVSIGGNAVNAVAYGNTASNTLTMSTFGAGIPSSALSNVQSNNGAVTATATSVAFSMTPTGATSGSALRNSGNTVSAQAVGNTSVSSIGGM
jgi:hypothetical protein